MNGGPPPPRARYSRRSRNATVLVHRGNSKADFFTSIRGGGGEGCDNFPRDYFSISRATVTSI